MDFIIGGTAACIACLFTNPLDVLKTRMQLQGELSGKGQYQVHYKNVFHAAHSVIQHDGVFGLHKGLIPALWIQVLVTGTRFGTFQLAESNGLITDQNGNLILHRTMLASAVGGVTGQLIASPFYLVKTHIQSKSADAIVVGHQHQVGQLWPTFVKMYKQGGMRGLYRGCTGALPRGLVGSVAQLTSFRFIKSELDNKELFQNRPFTQLFTSAMVAGVCMSVSMCPFDLIMTRIYNQPVDGNGKGRFYRHYYDCVYKIFKNEGLLAFYKGIGPLYLRAGSHSVFSLMFWDILKDLYEKILSNGHLR